MTVSVLRDHVAFDAPGEDVAHEADAPPGAHLAEAVSRGLARRAVRCGPVESSDFAYEFSVATNEGSGHLLLGYVGDDEGRRWLAFVKPSRSGLLRRRAAGTHAGVLHALHEVLVDDLRVVPQWFTWEEWEDPRGRRGADSPLV